MKPVHAVHLAKGIGTPTLYEISAIVSPASCHYEIDVTGAAITRTSLDDINTSGALIAVDSSGWIASGGADVDVLCSERDEGDERAASDDGGDNTCGNAKHDINDHYDIDNGKPGWRS